jgi:hypothetical protein
VARETGDPDLCHRADRVAGIWFEVPADHAPAIAPRLTEYNRPRWQFADRDRRG